MNKRIKKQTLRLLVATMMLTSVTGIANANETDVKVNTYAGKNRVETSIKSAQNVKSDTVVMASAYNFADSLSAYNTAVSNKAKLILVSDNTDVSKSLSDFNTKKVILVGGKNTLKGKAVDYAQENLETRRIAGKDRYETNDKTIKDAKFESVGVADGRNFPDALSSTGLLSSEKLGLKFVDGSKDYKSDEKVIYTFGGETSIKHAKGKRLNGKNRYHTSNVINDEMKSLGKVERIAVVSGENFADALSATNIINESHKNTAVMIVSKGITKKQLDYTNNINDISIVGGSILNNITQKLGGAYTERKANDEDIANTPISSKPSPEVDIEKPIKNTDETVSTLISKHFRECNEACNIYMNKYTDYKNNGSITDLNFKLETDKINTKIINLKSEIMDKKGDLKTHSSYDSMLKDIDKWESIVSSNLKKASDQAKSTLISPDITIEIIPEYPKDIASKDIV